MPSVTFPLLSPCLLLILLHINRDNGSKKNKGVNTVIIYKTTNLKNDKFYVGKDSNNNPKYLGSGTLLIKAINKYGRKNFKKEILEFCSSQKELNKREIFWIKTLNATDRNIAYNIKEGGEGGPLDDNTKMLISKALTGRTLSEEHKKNLSRTFSEEHKKKISEKHHDVSGSANPMFGKKHSQKVIEASRKRATGRKLSKETKLKMSKTRQGKLNSNAKLSKEKVLKIRDTHSKGQLSYREIGKIYGVQRACIYKIVNFLTWSHL